MIIFRCVPRPSLPVCPPVNRQTERETNDGWLGWVRFNTIILGGAVVCRVFVVTMRMDNIQCLSAHQINLFLTWDDEMRVFTVYPRLYVLTQASLIMSSVAPRILTLPSCFCLVVHSSFLFLLWPVWPSTPLFLVRAYWRSGPGILNEACCSIRQLETMNDPYFVILSLSLCVSLTPSLSLSLSRFTYSTACLHIY